MEHMLPHVSVDKAQKWNECMKDGQAIAVVTGGAQGIGSGISRRLAEDDYKVVIVDRDIEGAKRIADEIGGIAIPCDVTDPASIRAAAAKTGPVDVLVNNAGIWFVEDFLSVSDEKLEKVLSVNVMGVANCCRAFGPGMIERGSGSIINIASGASRDATPGYNIYPVTKSAVETLSRVLAMEWGPHGVRVNSIGPGAIQTENNAVNFHGDRLALRARTIPLQRTGVPADIAAVVSALCSPDMAYVTGQVFYVDGGLSAGRSGL